MKHSLLAVLAAAALAAPAAAENLARPDPAALAQGTRFACPNLEGAADKSSFFENPVYQGDDGWFFRLGNDIEDFTVQSPEAVDMLARLSQALKARGITLVYLPIPTRGMTDAARMPKGIDDGIVYDGKAATDGFHAMVERFRARGIVTADLLATLEKAPPAGDFHFARDIHWRPDGAKVGAVAIHAALGEDQIFAALPKKAFASAPKGDVELASPMRNALQSLCDDKLDVETLSTFETSASDISADDLLGGADDAAAPVAIVGTSYSDLPDFNFAGFLSETLGLDVANYSISGGGTFTAIMQWSHSGAMDKPLPAYLVWENPVAYRLDGDGIKDFRQIIPAVKGDCGAKAAYSGELTLEPGKPAVLTLPDTVSVSGHDAYLAMRLSDPTIRALKVSLDARDGNGEDIAIARPDRMANTDRAFLELSDDFEAPLATVTLSAPIKTAATVRIDICT
jgi:alginate biosynthesis protein AlgX